MKPKSAIFETQQLFADKNNYTDEKVQVDAKGPTQNLYELDASLFLSIGNGEKKKI